MTYDKKIKQIVENLDRLSKQVSEISDFEKKSLIIKLITLGLSREEIRSVVGSFDNDELAELRKVADKITKRSQKEKEKWMKNLKKSLIS